MPDTMKNAVLAIAPLIEQGPAATFQALFAPWITLTDLDIGDILHVTPRDLWLTLRDIHEQLGRLVDVLTEDQVQEAACRIIKQVTVYGAMTDLTDFRPSGITIAWDGGHWLFVSDPRTRLRESTPTYRQALAEVRTRLVG